MQEVLDRMIEVVTNQQNAPTSQVEEGLQQIYQGVTEIRRLIGSFEDCAETLDEIHNAVNTIGVTVQHVETAVGQLGHMMVQIGTAVTGLVHIANG